MNMSPRRAAIDYEPDSAQPQAFVVRRCLTATCDGCHGRFPDHAIGHCQSLPGMLKAINDSAWTLSSKGLRCPQCATPDEPADTVPRDRVDVAQSASWLDEVCCTVICCTHCHFHLENECGEAHFPSILAASAAALSLGWMFAAHQVWCVSCAARVGAARAPSPVSTTA